ncbi:universal stress protein [Haladaptatus pallidirubidus]|uniref:Universal stress protein n=1 Tax=Haladaptatus pallidirubidus TaxID=1008152 RepID=A0AAV3UPX7_9EURY|nr:universal stress protein [Haladaptatus pallidirubidus]
MVSRVLVAMDDSEMAAKAFRYALDVHADAEITVLTVVGEPSVFMGKATTIAMADDPEKTAEEYAQPVIDRAHEIAAEYGVELDTIVKTGHPVRQILNQAGDFDTIVLGSHSGTLADHLFVGNVAETVFRRSPVPVTVVR